VLIPRRACTAILCNHAGLWCAVTLLECSYLDNVYISVYRKFLFVWQLLLFLFHVGRPLWWVDGSVICSTITYWLESHRTHNHILLSSETIRTWRARSPYLYPAGTGWINYTSGHWVPFLSQGLRWTYSNPPPHGEEWDLSTISYIGIQFVPHRNHITSFKPASTRGRVRSFYYIIYRNSVCTSQESHYVILTRLHTGKSEIFLLYHI
jgi:hypothetical protein